MTLRSPRKLQIIRHNRPTSIGKLAGAAILCAVLAGPLSAQTRRANWIPVSPRDNVVQLIGLEEEPLDQLKQRSPRARWDELQQQGPRRGAARPLPPDVDGLSLPAPTSDSSEIPMLPDVDELREFDAFSAPPRQLPPRVARQPAPVPAREYDPEQPLPMPQPAKELPDVIRSLDAIDPYWGFKGTKQAPEDMANLDMEPKDVSFPEGVYQPRLSPETVFSWEAANIWHNPLYFEDAPLERYGHVANPLLQPFLSVGLFTTQLLGMPYQQTIDSPCRRRYTLGWLRPGECAPYKLYQIPLNVDAAAVQAGAVTAGFYILP